MVRQELQKLAVYAFFLAILLIPMLGFRSASFEPDRALKIWGVFVGILILNFIVKAVRGGRAAVEAHKEPWTERTRERISRIPRLYTIGGLALLAAVYPLMANNYMIDVGITCLIYVSLGLGLNIVVGLCGLLDLGYIAFYAVGAYTYSLLNLTFGVSFWAALPMGVVLGMVCGCIIGYPTLKMRGDYLAIVTLGFGEIVRLVLNNWDSLTAGPNGLFGMKRPTLYYPSFADGGFSWVAYYLKSLPALYYLILIIVVLTIVGVRRLDNSRIGRAWIAIREDETAAELSGVPTTWNKLLAYALGAAFASVAGAFFAAKLSYTNPNFFLFMESCIVLCIVVLGGVGSIPGIVVAGFVLIAVPEIFRGLENYRMLAFGAIMTIMMVVKPEGLIPASRRKRELHATDPHPHEESDGRDR
ncbi:MAG: branched-chain amino acid ABC transporter permease [Desulfobacterales bacterium]|nr:MAG: branched-chain amino acid ABC transporter permease [Desulfobacterales bacterium]